VAHQAEWSITRDRVPRRAGCGRPSAP
jgi:hypothetical protein